MLQQQAADLAKRGNVEAVLAILHCKKGKKKDPEKKALS
jgi:hypothetical protein